MPYHLTHPDSKQEIEVETEQVHIYTSQGWETKPGAKPPAEPDSK
jgi:hypothetical protein